MTGHRARLLVSHLKKSKAYEDFSQAFQHMTGLPLSLVPIGDTEPLVLQNGFCRLLNAGSDACPACRELHEQLVQQGSERGRTETCHAGLAETAVPIRLGQETLAYLRTGQVSLRPLEEKLYHTISDRLLPCAGSIGSSRLEQAFLQTKVLTWRNYNEAVRMLSVFAVQLATLAAQLPAEEVAHEPKEITRARRYIEEKYQEPIRLQEVAKVAHMSEFYFCRQFRDITGLTFTDYLTRTRVQQARKLLLSTDKRISEVAFEVGFQSLSQFNRSFRKLFGCAPTEFRKTEPESGAKAA